MVEKLSYDVAKNGLKAVINGMSVDEVARELVKYAREGLNKRNIVDNTGNNETHFLNVLEETLSINKTPAEQLLHDFSNKWKGNITNLIKEMSY